MKTHKNLYKKIYSKKNLIDAWRRARKRKTKKDYVIEFEKNIVNNINSLYEELKTQTYSPKPMEVFVLRDPKTRKISCSDFRDRVVHHALCNVIEPIFDKTFIYDNCANRKGKGNLFALRRFYSFMQKVSKNGKLRGWFNNNQIKGYCFKADIKHYFREINHEVLLNMIKRKIRDKQVLWLIKQIIKGARTTFDKKGMPLGNLTSQFFANVYLNELDKFAKHKLRAKYYIRYVDDFVLLHSSKGQLKVWKKEIEIFIKEKLKLELHKDKSRIINLSRGVDFVGFRNFYYFKLLRKRNIKSIQGKIKLFFEAKISQDKFFEIFQGWNAYASWANTNNVKKIFLYLCMNKK